MFDYIKRFIRAFREAYERLQQEHRAAEQRVGEHWITVALAHNSKEATLLMGKPSPEVFQEYLRRKGIREQLDADENLDDDSGATAA